MTNRFLAVERKLNDPGSSFVPRFSRRSVAIAQTKKKSKCTQFSEIDIEPDAFVLDVLQFFFDERLEADQLNDELRDIAARALWKATEGSKAMDMVPRPSGGRPSIGWLVSQAVQIAFRRAQNKCIYEIIRKTIKLSMRSEYELAKMGVSQSLQATMATSDSGVTMIKGFEGFRSKLYNAAGHCHIGYGHLVHRGKCDGTESSEFKNGITEARATDLLKERLAGYEKAVNDNVEVSLSQSQFDALVSFTFNVGEGAFKKSTLLKKLNSGKYDEVPSELNKWINGNGRVLPGLVKRRKAEGILFKDGIYPGTASAQSLYDQSWPGTGFGLTAQPGDLVYEQGASRRWPINPEFVLSRAASFNPTAPTSPANPLVSCFHRNHYKKELSISGSVKLGSKGEDVKKVQEWLNLWVYASPDWSTKVEVDGDFGSETETAVEKFQKMMGQPESALVDNVIFEILTNPLRWAFTRIDKTTDLRKLILAYAEEHVKSVAYELNYRGQGNRGPWVRSYMLGRDGKDYLWCVGFVQTILDLAFSTLGRDYATLMPVTGSCDDMGERGLSDGVLIRNNELPTRINEVKPGDLFLKVKAPRDWAHIGIVTSVSGNSINTIEGNTNHRNSNNGVEVCSRSHDFTKKNIDIFKLTV